MNVMKNKRKKIVVPLKEIRLPDQEDLQKILLQWLQSKYADIKMQENRANEKNILCEIGTLTDTLSVCSKSVQTKVDSADITCQTVTSVTNISVQTYNDWVNTDLSSIKEKSKFMTALSLNHSGDSPPSSPNNKSPRLCRRRQQDMNSPVPSKIFISENFKEKDAKEKSTQTDILNITNNFFKGSMMLSTFNNIDNLKPVPLNIFTNECSDFSVIKKEDISSNECSKNAKNNRLPTTIVSDKSPDLLSPRSATLLKVGKRHHRVYVCGSCDKVTYTIKEKLAHRKTHLHCALCKKRFRSIVLAESHKKECELNEEHSDDGVIESLHQATSNGKLFVLVSKLDFDDNLRNLYPSAFSHLQEMLEK